MQVSSPEIAKIVIVTTLVFLLAPAFLLLYISSYNRRKKLHKQEKIAMKNQFEAEVLKTQLEVQERTMQAIGAELHDNIGQLLSLTSVTLSSVDIQQQEAAETKIKDSQQLVNRSIKELRHLAKLFYGEQLVKAGLDKALAQELERIEKTGQYRVIYKSNLKDTMNSQKDLIILRIIQELLNNIIKHAEAKTIRVELDCAGGHLFLTVSDDGKGFDLAGGGSESGMGMHTVQKRVDLLEGRIGITSARNEGTKIAIEIPYP